MVVREGSQSIGQVLRWAQTELREFDSASLDSEVLLGQLLHVNQAYLVGHAERDLTGADLHAFRELIRRRALGEPVAYIVGEVEWFGRRFKVTSDVLVPRPETELVLEAAVSIAGRIGARTIIDVGTGSGNIACLVACLLPDVSVFATDVSREALLVAQANARRLLVAGRVSFVQSSLIDCLARPPDLIVANLPYIRRSDMSCLPSPVRHEPEVALDGGNSGLDMYSLLFGQMRERGWRIPLVLEIGSDQGPSVSSLMGTMLAPGTVDVRKDYANLDRIALYLPQSGSSR